MSSGTSVGGSEVLKRSLLWVQRYRNGESTAMPGSSHHHHLSVQVTRFSEAFPVSSPLLAYSFDPERHGSPGRRDDHHKNLALREYIRSQLPRREEADYLWEQARRNAMWPCVA